MRLQIDNEYDKLEAVMVHRPGGEIDRLTHDCMRQFLFEDIPFLRRLQDEHDAFVAAMRGRGVDVVYLEHFLLDICRDDASRSSLIDQVCTAEAVPAIADDLKDAGKFSPEALVEMMFAGMTAAEFYSATGQRSAVNVDDAHFLLPPIPNSYFSRDPAVVVRGSVVSSKMHFQERVRETILVRAVLEHHKDFRDDVIAFGSSNAPREDRPFTIEGGDILILSDESILVGASERTRGETIELLASKLFQDGSIKRVYEIPIPAERAFMHLDTVFTILDRGTVLWFPEVMRGLSGVMRYEADGASDNVTAKRIADDRLFENILSDEFGTKLTAIDTGGGSKHFAPREQRMDGTNALAIAPRVAITYERNERTIAAMEEAGVECIRIEGSELVRGLGGPRCMTMPLRRSSQMSAK